MSNLQGLVSAREAQSAVGGRVNPCAKLEALQQRSSADARVGLVQLAVLGGLGADCAAVGYWDLRGVALLDSRQRQQQAEQQQREARLQEQEAKRVNDANQAAILRLMNELQIRLMGT